MRITYDPAKREWTLRERGLDFDEADALFAGPTLTVVDVREGYDEDRYLTFGYLRRRMMVVVWTPRGDDERWIISMRKANAREQARFAHRLGQGRRDNR